MRNEKILRHFSPVEPLPPLLLLAGGPKLSSSETCPTGCLPLLWLPESSALPPSSFLTFICCVPSVLRPTTPLTSKTKRTTWRTQELCKRVLCHEANRSSRKARRAEGAEKMANHQRWKNKSAHKWRYPHIASATQKNLNAKNCQKLPTVSPLTAPLMCHLILIFFRCRSVLSRCRHFRLGTTGAAALQWRRRWSHFCICVFSPCLLLLFFSCFISFCNMCSCGGVVLGQGAKVLSGSTHGFCPRH